MCILSEIGYMFGDNMLFSGGGSGIAQFYDRNGHRLDQGHHYEQKQSWKRKRKEPSQVMLSGLVFSYYTFFRYRRTKEFY